MDPSFYAYGYSATPSTLDPATAAYYQAQASYQPQAAEYSAYTQAITDYQKWHEDYTKWYESAYGQASAAAPPAPPPPPPSENPAPPPPATNYNYSSTAASSFYPATTATSYHTGSSAVGSSYTAQKTSAGSSYYTGTTAAVTSYPGSTTPVVSYQTGTAATNTSYGAGYGGSSTAVGKSYSTGYSGSTANTGYWGSTANTGYSGSVTTAGNSYSTGYSGSTANTGYSGSVTTAGNSYSTGYSGGAANTRYSENSTTTAKQSYSTGYSGSAASACSGLGAQGSSFSDSSSNQSYTTGQNYGKAKSNQVYRAPPGVSNYHQPANINVHSQFSYSTNLIQPKQQSQVFKAAPSATSQRIQYQPAKPKKPKRKKTAEERKRKKIMRLRRSIILLPGMEEESDTETETESEEEVVEQKKKKQKPVQVVVPHQKEPMEPKEQTFTEWGAALDEEVVSGVKGDAPVAKFQFEPPQTAVHAPATADPSQLYPSLASQIADGASKGSFTEWGDALPDEQKQYRNEELGKRSFVPPPAPEPEQPETILRRNPVKLVPEKDRGHSSIVNTLGRLVNPEAEEPVKQKKKPRKEPKPQRKEDNPGRNLLGMAAMLSVIGDGSDHVEEKEEETIGGDDEMEVYHPEKSWGGSRRKEWGPASRPEKTWGGDVVEKTWGGDVEKTWGGDVVEKTWGGEVVEKTWGGEVVEKTWGGEVVVKTWGGEFIDDGKTWGSREESTSWDPREEKTKDGRRIHARNIGWTTVESKPARKEPPKSDDQPEKTWGGGSSDEWSRPLLPEKTWGASGDDRNNWTRHDSTSRSGGSVRPRDIGWTPAESVPRKSVPPRNQGWGPVEQEENEDQYPAKQEEFVEQQYEQPTDIRSKLLQRAGMAATGDRFGTGSRPPLPGGRGRGRGGFERRPELPGDRDHDRGSRFSNPYGDIDRFDNRFTRALDGAPASSSENRFDALFSSSRRLAPGPSSQFSTNPEGASHDEMIGGRIKSELVHEIMTAENPSLTAKTILDKLKTKLDLSKRRDVVTLLSQKVAERTEQLLMSMSGDPGSGTSAPGGFRGGLTGSDRSGQGGIGRGGFPGSDRGGFGGSGRGGLFGNDRGGFGAGGRGGFGGSGRAGSSGSDRGGFPSSGRGGFPGSGRGGPGNNRGGPGNNRGGRGGNTRGGRGASRGTTQQALIQQAKVISSEEKFKALNIPEMKRTVEKPPEFEEAKRREGDVELNPNNKKSKQVAFAVQRTLPPGLFEMLQQEQEKKVEEPAESTKKSKWDQTERGPKKNAGPSGKAKDIQAIPHNPEQAKYGYSRFVQGGALSGGKSS